MNGIKFFFDSYSRSLQCLAAGVGISINSSWGESSSESFYFDPSTHFEEWCWDGVGVGLVYFNVIFHTHIHTLWSLMRLWNGLQQVHSLIHILTVSLPWG